MKFRTEYTPLPSEFKLSPEHPVIMLGSCFSDNIASRMRRSLWDAVNPAGTLYNPESIAMALEYMLPCTDFQDKAKKSLLRDSRGIWHSFLFDSKVSAKTKEGCLEKILSARNVFLEKIADAEVLFVTFGTSIVYALKNENEEDKTDYRHRIVSNCHKLPASCFVRFRLTVEEIAVRWSSLCRMIRRLYPHLRIVFTVSPVRHLKDGFTANSRSKAVLQLAVEEICAALPFCSYFPAYEILNDDLRDYRFYSSDLAHPSEQAVDYIWEIFRATYLDEAGQQLLKEGERLVRAYEHRPLIADDNERADYKAGAEKRIREFIDAHPGMKSL